MHGDTRRETDLASGWTQWLLWRTPWAFIVAGLVWGRLLFAFWIPAFALMGGACVLDAAVPLVPGTLLLIVLGIASSQNSLRARSAAIARRSSRALQDRGVGCRSETARAGVATSGTGVTSWHGEEPGTLVRVSTPAVGEFLRHGTGSILDPPYLARSEITHTVRQ